MIFFKTIWNELKKEILTAWSYKIQWIGEFLSLLFFFIFLITLSKEKQIAGIGYCLWFYSILIIGGISGKISIEMRSGTFEQIYLSTVPIPLLLLAKVISEAIKSFIIMIILFTILFILGYTNFSNSKNLNLPYIILILTPGLFGLSLFIGGLTILIKDTGWIINILNNSLLFLSGIFIPIGDFPPWLQYASHMSLINQAIELIKINNFINEINLLTTSLVYLLLGIFTFLTLEKKAKLKGCLGHY